jgi:polyisoprenyl-teichoic acid--peptidoglycan teichoic acid transferase
MAQTPRRTPPKKVAKSQRPGHDVVVAQQADKFPSVGMTLPSYHYDPTDKRRRSSGKTVVKRSRWQNFKQKVSLKRTVIVMALLVLLIGGFVFGKFAWNAHKIFGGNIFGVFSNTKLKGEDSGRVNILLAGNSADDAGHNGGQLTDSIMLISIDVKNNKAFMLSIPRDLWVKVPGDGHSKINSVYVTGEANNYSEYGYPDGGMGQLEQTISDALEIPINYYALVDYTALRQSVDAVGGVDFTVNSKDPRGLYDPNIDWETKGPLVKLSNGTHHLNGRQALDLARARGDAYNSYGFAASDFDRTEHQRQLLAALKDKAISAGVLSNPAKLTSLSDAIGNNVKTDFKINEVHRLYDILKNINGSSIKSLSLNDDNGENLLASYSSPNGQSALIPAAGIDDYSDIQTFLKKQTSTNAVVQEGAKIVVLNGTTTNGLATKIKNQLKTKNMNVSDIGDAGNTAQTTSTIIDLSATHKPGTKAALIKFFGNHVTTQNPYGTLYDADFIIVLGSDQANASSSSTTSN